MKLEIEDDRTSKRPKTLDSMDKQGRRAIVNIPMLSIETDVSSHCDHVHVESSTIERAERIRENLSPEFPSFLKTLSRTHVSGDFKLYIPRIFWKELPEQESPIVLVDESGQVHQAKYSIGRSRRLTSGWKRFSVEHKLVEGDVLVFHLIGPCKFRVYIVRAREANGTHHLVNRSSHIKRTKTDASGSHNDNSFSDIQESSEISVSLTKFKNVKNFEDFKISVGDIIINSEIPTDIMKKYYELCCGQKMFLHDHVIEGLSCKLVGLMISETVDIVDAIKASNMATSLEKLKCWGKSLKGFEILGLSVGFLRTWLNKHIRLNCETEAIIESKREKRVRLDEEMETLTASLKKAKELMSSLEAEVVALEVKKEKLGIEFMELAGARKLESGTYIRRSFLVKMSQSLNMN